MFFSRAQTFYLDKEVVANASEVSLTSVDLFFKLKPKATNNKSGIQNPGVSVTICATSDSVPKIYADFPYQFARVEYAEIVASSDGTTATRFRFRTPIPLKTDREYAIVIKYDGNEDFVLWVSKQGDYLLGTTTISPGPSGKFVGKYYEFDVPQQTFSSATVNTSQQSSNTDPTLMKTDTTALVGSMPVVLPYRAINDTDVKFRVNAARYAHNGVPVEANTGLPSNTQVYSSAGVTRDSNTSLQQTFAIPFNNMEYVVFDNARSLKDVDGSGGSRVYQNTVFWPGGFANSASCITISVTANSTLITANTQYPNGQNFGWGNVYAVGNNEEFIVITSLDHTGGTDRLVNVRKVAEIISNTVLRVDEKITFSNSVCNFFKSPIGRVRHIDKTNSFGAREDLLILTDSNSNTTCRFVNNTIEAVTVVAGGTGYSNGDILYIKGFENVDIENEGGYLAIANVSTNSTGGIVTVYISNQGAGFNNASAAAIVVANSTSGNTTGNTSAGSGLTANLTIDATLRSEYHTDEGYFKGCRIVNLKAGVVNPRIRVRNPSGSSYTMYHQVFEYVQPTANVLSNVAYYGFTTPTNTRKQVTPFQANPLVYANAAALVSRGNEFIINYSNGSFVAPNNNKDPNANNVLALIKMSSNNDFICCSIDPSPQLEYGYYAINNDYTNEHTNRGNAHAKGVTKKVNFGPDRAAEDIVVFLTAYKPSNTDIKVYARIHNNLDTEDEFDDKDWTLLQLKDGNNIVSSATNDQDYIELTYGFGLFPNSSFTFGGVVSTTNASSTINGSGTDFTNATSNVIAGDLIKIYQPLFPNNYQIAVVNSVTNTTQITIKGTTTNNGILGDGLKIDKLAYKFQAFNNILQDNVVRYYNSSMVEFDTFNTMQIKIVLLSDNSSLIPRVDDIRAIGVSA